MEKDFNLTFPGKDGSLAPTCPQTFWQKQHSSSCMALVSSYSDAMATGCQGDTRKAVADSKKTKAVIASRRHDFFSDLMLPSTISTSNSSDCLSTTSFPSTIPSAYVRNYSMHVNDPLPITSIPRVSDNIPSTTVNISTNDTNVSLIPSYVNIPSVAIQGPLDTAYQPSSTVNDPSTNNVGFSSSRANIPSATVNVPLATVNVSSTTVNVPSTTVNAFSSGKISSTTGVNIPSSFVDNPLSSIGGIPSASCAVPSAAMNVPSIATNVSSATVKSNVSSRNPAAPALTDTNIYSIGIGTSMSGSNSSHLVDHSFELTPLTTSSTLFLNTAESCTAPTSSSSKTAAHTISSSSTCHEMCNVPDHLVKRSDTIPSTSSLKLVTERLDNGVTLEASKLELGQRESVQINYGIVSATDSKIGFEKPNDCKNDEAAFSLESSDFNSGKADGVKSSSIVPHITGLNHRHPACPPVEYIRAPVQVLEPVCFEATPCGSIHLEPSPERIWGPHVSFLTFSCLDISRTEVVGQMRQVSSTGCLEVLGSGHRQDNGSEGTKLIPSNGEFGSSSHSVSDSEKCTNAGRSPLDDNKSVSVSNSCQDFDWNRMTVDHASSLRSKKTSSGWFHSPSLRRKRDPTVDRDAIPGAKIKESWKGRMAKTFSRVGSATALSPADRTLPVRAKGTFDVPIELCVPSTKNEGLPLFVELCTRVIEERGIANQGIYRVPGNNGFVRQMVEDLNEDASGLCSGNDRWHDVNVVSSLLKLFFRRLPDPLITYKLYQPVIDASRIVDIDARLLRLRDVLHDLPPVNLRTFQFVAQHLSCVAKHEQVNKMDAHNLAIIFGPTLIRPREGNMVAVINDMNDQCRIVESVILHYDWFFGLSEEESEVPRSEESTPVSSMSEELLAKAQQLGEFESPSCGAINRVATTEVGHKEKFHWGRDQKNSNDSDLALADTPPTIVREESESSIHEIVFEIKRYPAYHYNDSSMFCTENAKPKVRRTHSNESLGLRIGGSPAFGRRQNRSTVKSSAVPFNASCGQLTE